MAKYSTQLGVTRALLWQSLIYLPTSIHLVFKEDWKNDL